MRYFLFLVLLTQQAVAQVVSGVATYRLEMLYDPQSNQYGVSTYELRFNKNQSEFVMINNPSIDYEPYGIIKDFTRKRMIAPEPTFDKNYFVEDSLVAIPWEISNKERMIGKWKCNAAYATVRGREYEVWFAPDLALEDGPWKLYGLPGLILDAHSKDNKVKIVIDKLEFRDSSVVVRDIYNFGNPDNVSSKKFEKILEESIKRHMKIDNTTSTLGENISFTQKLNIPSIDIYPFQLENDKE
ncbi:GLPGLI family protein [Siphonobacter sp. SORGH_AS_1065]|uniref:GLPGLI family protein n=1 Tax=Siphonobacter sp. SORGH_AS_1065 TaxID=3041795 RepID=UPI00277D936B|nr:GLPGLI family protein [Siphonobacter sp. SORGH_AS_1065]MDQ1085488.1 hypothetical protein [Siphonobacter sp. SORGH_AS_1065]